MADDTNTANNTDAGKNDAANTGSAAPNAAPNPCALLASPSREYVVRCSTKEHAVAAREAIRSLYDEFVDVREFRYVPAAFAIFYRGEDGPLPEQTRRAISEAVYRIDDGAKASVPAKRKALENIAARPA